MRALKTTLIVGITCIVAVLLNLLVLHVWHKLGTYHNTNPAFADSVGVDTADGWSGTEIRIEIRTTSRMIRDAVLACEKTEPWEYKGLKGKRLDLFWQQTSEYSISYTIFLLQEPLEGIAVLYMADLNGKRVVTKFADYGYDDELEIAELFIDDLPIKMSDEQFGNIYPAALEDIQMCIQGGFFGTGEITDINTTT